MKENCISVNDNLLSPQYEERLREMAWLFDLRNQLVTRREKTRLAAVKSCSVVIALLEVISKRLISWGTFHSCGKRLGDAQTQCASCDFAHIKRDILHSGAGEYVTFV